MHSSFAAIVFSEISLTDFRAITRMAIDSAKSGDKSARDWVSKWITAYQPSQLPTPGEPMTWRQYLQSIIGDLNESSDRRFAAARALAQVDTTIEIDDDLNALFEGSDHPISSIQPSKESKAPQESQSRDASFEAFHSKRNEARDSSFEEILACGDAAKIRLHLAAIYEEISSIEGQLKPLQERDWHGSLVNPWSQENQRIEEALVLHKRELLAKTHQLHNAIAKLNGSAK